MKCGNFEAIERPGEIGCSRVARIPFWVFLLLIICSRQTYSLAFDNTTDIFVQKCQMECNLRRDFTTCGKYKVVKWFNTIVREKEFNYGPFRVIRIPSIEQSFLPNLPHSRALKHNNIVETLNFIRGSIEDLLTKRAIVYTVDNSASARSFSHDLMVVDEDEIKQMQNGKESEGDWRIFKKKKSIIFPILILLNLIKLKLLLLPIFLGVHFIKKLLVLGSLILPSILAHLKVCKVQHSHHTHPYHLWSTAAESSVDYPSGYGQDESTWHRNDYQLGYPNFQIFRNPYG